jgi:hypothetical protein
MNQHAMQINSDQHENSGISYDAEDVSQAQQLWHRFTLFMKWGTIACAIVLILLGLITL